MGDDANLLLGQQACERLCLLLARLQERALALRERAKGGEAGAADQQAGEGSAASSRRQAEGLRAAAQRLEERGEAQLLAARQELCAGLEGCEQRLGVQLG